MPSLTAENPMTTFKEYCEQADAYDAMIKDLGPQVHTVSPCHPVKTILRNLVAMMRSLPAEKVTEYMVKRDGLKTV
jgi:poly-beta-hydroxyalkanoate depolymerase